MTGPAIDQPDCIAVLGSISGTRAQTRLELLPYSGVDREKTLGALDDDELGRLCDFSTCLASNGYSRNCYPADRYSFAESIPIVALAGEKCLPNTNQADGRYETTWGSRPDCRRVYRELYSRCHVGNFEDCGRESVSEPLASLRTPSSCAALRAECPVR